MSTSSHSHLQPVGELEAALGLVEQAAQAQVAAIWVQASI